MCLVTSPKKEKKKGHFVVQIFTPVGIKVIVDIVNTCFSEIVKKQIKVTSGVLYRWQLHYSNNSSKKKRKKTVGFRFSQCFNTVQFFLFIF